MVLKSDNGLSDQALMDQLNGNIHYQLFCGVRIDPLRPLDNFKIISEIRCELARKLKIDELQKVLAASLIRSYSQDSSLSSLFHKRFSVIKKVHQQQQARFMGKPVKGVIVSIDKDYIRPIVRGNETKAVEFGAKVNTLQVDGINFIGHLSF